jgi:hypothetical protein
LLLLEVRIVRPNADDGQEDEEDQDWEGGVHSNHCRLWVAKELIVASNSLRGQIS